MDISRIAGLVWLKLLLASVSMLLVVACSSGGGNGSELASWTAPSEREDGAVLLLSEISGYRVYYGTETGIYPNQLFVSEEAITAEDVASIPAGKYFFVVATVDTNGLESVFSTVLEVTF